MKRAVQRNSSEVLRDEMFMQRDVAAVLREEPKTIPDIAAQLNRPASEVTTWVMAMVRYGKVTPVPKKKSDDYFQYRLTESKA
jgi:hypothetical protein